MIAQPFGIGVLKSEGVVVDRDNHVYGAGRGGEIFRVAPDGSVAIIHRMAAESVPNGITLDHNGDLIICDLGHRAVLRLDRSGRLSLVADRAGDVALTMPNFCTYDADGNLFVSNSSTNSWPDAAAEMARPEAKGALVRIRPNGRGDVVATGLWLANGTAIDPREEAVYVLQSTRMDCLRIALRKDGSFGRPEIYARDFPGIPDGMAFAADGTLIVTIPIAMVDGEMVRADHILRVDTDGSWRYLVDGRDSTALSRPTNCAFGGHGLADLYIANIAGEHFGRIEGLMPGHALYHQR